MSGKWLAKYLREETVQNQDSLMDPGADIDPDGKIRWQRLLRKARAVSHEFYSRLFYIRGAGAKLLPAGQAGYRIVPILDPQGIKGWASLEEYAREKWCLQPYVQELIQILRDIDANE